MSSFAVLFKLIMASTIIPEVEHTDNLPFVRTESLNPEELDKDESETLDFLSNAALGQISLPAMAALTADEIFGKEMDDTDNEYLFLNALLDETQPLQSELMAKLEAMFDANGFMPPDKYSFQVFKRKAGYTVSKKSEDDLSKIAKYCAAICLKDYQIIVYDNKEHIISSGMISQVFELQPHPDFKKSKYAPRPSVPRNRTQIKLGQGKATIKPRSYLCFLVWAFWNGDPIKVVETKMDGTELQNVIDRLKDTIVDSDDKVPNESIMHQKELVI